MLGRSISSELPNQYRVIITADRPWEGWATEMAI